MKGNDLLLMINRQLLDTVLLLKTKVRGVIQVEMKIRATIVEARCDLSLVSNELLRCGNVYRISSGPCEAAHYL